MNEQMLAKAYEKKVLALKVLLADLTRAVDELPTEAPNWGHVGSLGYAIDELAETVRIVKSITK